MKRRRSHIKKYWDILWLHEKSPQFIFCLTVLCGFAWVSINAVLPVSLKFLVDSFASSVTGAAYWFIPFLPLVYGFLWALGRILARVQSLLADRVSERSLNILLGQAFEHYLKRTLTSHQHESIGETLNLFSRVQSNLPRFIEGLLCHVFPLMVETLLAMVFISHFCGFRYITALLFVVVSYFFLLFSTAKWVARLQRICNRKESALASFLSDKLHNFETIKFFNTEEAESLKCRKALSEKEKISNAVSLKIKSFSLIYFLLLGSGIAVILSLAWKDVQQGVLTLGDMILLNAFLLQFSFPMSYLGHIVQDIRRALTSIDELFDIIERQPKEIGGLGRKITSCRGPIGLSFRNVGFAYRGKPPLLKGVSFECSPGTVLGIVGPSGEGKSTLLKLMCGVYKPTYGAIRIAGQDIRSLAIPEVRSLIGVVPQDVTLFNTTIRENLTLGNYAVKKADIDKVIERVGLAGFIEHLPEGLESIVGERGVKISGGERQRIGLARVLLKQPKIYILDEATSSLDLLTERKILECLEEERGKATVIIIAHRLSTIIHADHILVLRDGIIFEEGKHTRLLEIQGAYAALWKAQRYAY